MCLASNGEESDGRTRIAGGAAMVSNKVGGVVGILLLVVGLLTAPAGADDAKTWPVKHRLWGTAVQNQRM